MKHLTYILLFVFLQRLRPERRQGRGRLGWNKRIKLKLKRNKTFLRH